MMTYAGLQVEVIFRKIYCSSTDTLCFTGFDAFVQSDHVMQVVLWMQMCSAGIHVQCPDALCSLGCHALHNQVM